MVTLPVLVGGRKGIWTNAKLIHSGHLYRPYSDAVGTQQSVHLDFLVSHTILEIGRSRSLPPFREDGQEFRPQCIPRRGHTLEGSQPTR